MDNEKKCWYKVHILFVVPLAIMVTMAEKRGMPFNKDVVHFFLATLFFFFFKFDNCGQEIRILVVSVGRTRRCQLVELPTRL